MDKGVLYNGLVMFNVPLLCCLAVSWIVNFYLLNAADKYLKYVRRSYLYFFFFFLETSRTNCDFIPITKSFAYIANISNNKYVFK